VTWLPAPGELSVEAVQLELEKAQHLAAALQRLPFVQLVECRRNVSPLSETIVFETEVELPQHPVLDVRAKERVAVTFSSDASAVPEILALRDDFPLVPHLNRRSFEFPRSLCVYEDAFPEFSFKWSPVRFIEDIRVWLARTARNELHQPNQPLEPLLEAGALELIFPPSILSDIKSGDYLFLEHDVFEDSQRSVHVRKKVASAAEASMFAVYVQGKTQTHGLIRREPATLADLQDFLRSAGIDVVECTRRALKDYLAHGGGRGGTALLALFIDLPKSRKAGQPAETTDRLAFVAEARIEELSAALGVSQRFGNNVGYLLGGAVAAARPEQLRVVPMRRMAMLTPESAAEFNGVQSVADAMAFIGLGALGSQLFMNLWRSGFGRWTLIDRDLHLPHNDSRHALVNGIGEFKARAMASFAGAIFPEHVPAHIVADVLTAGSRGMEVQAAIQNCVAVIDCSASVAVGRHLAHSYGGGRRICVFLNPSGTDLVLLAEPADRSIRVDQLEMMYYRAIVEDKRMDGHLLRADAPVRYSNACRDLSTVISQDYIATHAGIGSRAIRNALASSSATIAIWRTDDRGTVTRIDVPVARPVAYSARGWSVLFDSVVQEMVTNYRLQRLPNETGGVLLGSFDMARKVALVSGALPSPEDSKEWPTVYIRGSAGLRAAVSRSEIATGGGLEYVGEWHSHPSGATAGPSKDDRRALSLLSEVMAEDARPAVMLIVADGELGLHVRDHLGPGNRKRAGAG
jgi:integrative and conjugative element protein (TIGR02256 family)